MKKLNNFYLLFIIFLLAFLFPTISFAQTNDNNNTFKKHYSINLNGGPTLFWGDLRQYDYYPVINNKNEWNISYGLILNWQISPVFGLRGQLLNGKLSGSNRDINNYFKADILSGNISTSINFSNLFFKYKAKRFFSVYGIAGIGLSNWKTEMKDLQNNNLIASNGTGNGRGFWGRTLEGNIPLGVGFNFRINNNFVINLENTFYGFNSDKLDTKVSGSKYDMFSYSSLGLTYKFPVKNKAPLNIKETAIETDKEKSSPPKTEPDTNTITETPVKDISKDEIVEKKKEINEEQKQKIQQEKTQTIATHKKKAIPKTNISKREKGVVPKIEYRVQILAKLNRASSLSFISNKYNLNETIKEDFHNGYYIYTIGSFKNYEATRKHRDKLRLENKIYDAYVVVFVSGKRLDKLSDLKK